MWGTQAGGRRAGDCSGSGEGQGARRWRKREGKEDREKEEEREKREGRRKEGGREAGRAFEMCKMPSEGRVYPASLGSPFLQLSLGPGPASGLPCRSWCLEGKACALSWSRPQDPTYDWLHAAVGRPCNEARPNSNAGFGTN